MKIEFRAVGCEKSDASYVRSGLLCPLSWALELGGGQVVQLGSRLEAFVKGREQAPHGKSSRISSYSRRRLRPGSRSASEGGKVWQIREARRASMDESCDVASGSDHGLDQAKHAPRGARVW